MRQKLTIRNLGPVKSCTIKNDMFEQITHRPSEDEYEENIVKSAKKNAVI